MIRVLVLLSALLVGCSATGVDDTSAPSSTPDAGGAGEDAPAGDAGPIFAPEDTAVVADDASTDATVGSTPNIWSFNGYCGASLAACPSTYPACPSFPAGAAGQTCSVAFERCVAADTTGTYASKIFDCLPTGKSVWDLNALCAVAGCTPGSFPACPDPGTTGVAGQGCATVGDRCLTTDKLFRCLPGGAQVWLFNGYCSLSTSPIAWLPACDATMPACAVTSVAGAACPKELDRCLSGNKIFACAKR